MPSEFIARKGLISHKSSSFDETLFVSGSISSPVEAYLTASWARNAETASYSAQSGYLMSINTSSQAIAVINTYQEVIFVKDTKNSGWTHPASSGRFTSSYTAEYSITTILSVQKTGAGTQTLASRILYNGSEASGSYVSLPMTTNNVQNQLTSHIILNVASGSGFIVQIAATSTNMSLTPPTLIGSSVARTSAEIVITKV
jgi:hypothetical protein